MAVRGVYCPVRPSCQICTQMEKTGSSNNPLQSIKFVSEDFEFIRRVNYPPLTVNTPTTFVRTMEK